MHINESKSNRQLASPGAQQLARLWSQAIVLAEVVKLVLKAGLEKCLEAVVQIALSARRANDAPMAEWLLKDLPTGAHVIADKGYDADWIRELFQDQDCTPSTA